MAGSGADTLGRTRGLPERHLEAGSVLFAPGDAVADEVVLLVSGRLRVELDGTTLAEIDQPGAFVGEVASLLRSDRSATVIAMEPTTVRSLGGAEACFATYPDLALELARQLAARLQTLNLYLGDLRRQYAGERGHLEVFDAVLGRLSTTPPMPVEPGSDREPDYT